MPEKINKPMKPVEATASAYYNLRASVASLYRYSSDRIEKFPKSQKLECGLAAHIMDVCIECLRRSIRIHQYNPKVDREAELRELSNDIKLLQSLVHCGYLKRYVSMKNFDAWGRKLTMIDNSAIGLAMWLEKTAKEKLKKK